MSLYGTTSSTRRRLTGRTLYMLHSALLLPLRFVRVWTIYSLESSISGYWFHCRYSQAENSSELIENFNGQCQGRINAKLSNPIQMTVVSKVVWWIWSSRENHMTIKLKDWLFLQKNANWLQLWVHIPFFLCGNLLTNVLLKIWISTVMALLTQIGKCWDLA